MSSPLLVAALRYAAAGHPVFPVVPGGKVPLAALVPRGLKAATTDPDTIRGWWRKAPAANIGLRADGLVILDVDPPEGDESLAALEAEHAPLPPTRTQTTPSGGRHFVLRAPHDGIGNSTRGIGTPVGLDIRAGNRGYIVAAPSRNGSAAYRWTASSPIADAPTWLVDALTRPPREEAIVRPARVDGEVSAYAKAALVAEVAAVETALEGSRNSTLNASAFALGQLEAGGELPLGATEKLLVFAAIRAGLGEAEARRTAVSGLDAGRSSPRSAPDTANGSRTVRVRRRPGQGEDNREDREHSLDEAFVVEGNEARGVGLIPLADDESLDMASSPSAVTADLTGFPFTDLGNARRFTAMHEGRFLHAREERIWLEWRATRWWRDRTGASDRAAKEVVEELWRQVAGLPHEKRERAAKWAIACQSEQRLRSMLALASTEPGMFVTLEDLDADPWLLSCGNGTVDLHSGELRDPDPADLISLGTEIDFNINASRARWLTFLDEVFDGDRELIAFVKRAYGSCLTGDTRDRALFIEYGARFNGKSTLNHAVQHALGDFAHTAPIRVVMRGRQSEIPNEIAALHRKRLVVIAETADGHRLDENRVKMLTGRDRVPARYLHREWFTFEPEYKLVLYTNFAPKVDGSDGAIWDRIRLIPFRVSFADREDQELGENLKAEAEGILAWLVEGCLEWQATGLGTCDAVERATAAYRTENDTIGRFVDECCELGDDCRVERKALRASLAAYCDDAGDEPPPPATLGRWLTERGVRDSRSGGNRAYRGIRLLEASP